MSRRENRNIELTCPKDDCDGTVHASLAWEPPEPNYGADADGNRGMYVAGYWYVEDVGSTCNKGHTMDTDDAQVLSEEATARAQKDSWDDDGDYGED